MQTDDKTVSLEWITAKELPNRCSSVYLGSQPNDVEGLMVGSCFETESDGAATRNLVRLSGI